MNETEQRYHSNKQEFLALKWAVTEQFHEYLSPYGKNRNEFVVRTDNNPLTYIFFSANLDAAGQRWVAQLASYNFSLEYQKGKDNTVADFLSHLDDRLPAGEVQDYLNKIPYPGVKAVLDNAIMPLTERAEQGVGPNPNNQKASQEVTIGARPARLATTNITDWKLEQQEDIMSLDRLAQEIGGQLPLIKGMGGSLVEPIRFVLMNVKVPCVQGYDEDQVALVMDDPEMSECPVILGTSTLYWVMEVIKESEISKLAVPWSSSRISWLMRDVTAKLGQVVVNDMANKPIAPLDVDEVVRVASKCTVPPFGHKVIHGKVNLVLHGCRLNVMTHGLEKRLPSLPLGIDVQTAYATLANGSH